MSTMKYASLDLGTIEAVFNKLGGLDGAQRFLRDELVVTEAKKPPLLVKVASFGGPAVARFVVDDAMLKECNVGATGPNFKKFFNGKVEVNVKAAVIGVNRLERAECDPPIITELGDRAQIALAHFFGQIRKQSHGEDGVLLTNGYANICYAIGNNKLWAVCARWRARYGYWDVEVDSIEDPYGWGDGRQVLSRDSGI